MAHPAIGNRAPAPPVGITRRSVVLGLALTVIHTVWLIYEELALQHIGQPSIFTLVQTVVGILFALLAFNSAVARRRPGWVLGPAEIMVVFTMTTFGAIVTSCKLLHYLFPVVMWPGYMPAQSGGAGTASALPGFFAPHDPAVTRAFFEGTRDPAALFRPSILRAWLLPMAFWGCFLFLLFWTMQCLASLFRRQWIDRERIPFPIIDLPILMARSGDLRGLFSNRLLATGFAASSLLLSMNYLSSLVPWVPGIKLAEQDIGTTYIVSPPWSSVNPILTVWWPYAIGLCYLIPLDVSFSCWFFFLLIRALVVAATALGWRDPGSAHDLGQFPYFGNLAEGAWLGMFGVVIWSSRKPLAEIWRAVLRRQAIDGDSSEAMPYRTALIGSLVGMALLVAASVLAGMRLKVALLAFGLYFIAIVVMARMYAQVAMPLFCMAFFSFTAWTTSFTGTAGITGAEARCLTTYYWFDRTYEQIPMGHHLETLTIADRLGQSRRTMSRVMLLATGVAILLGMVTLLQIYHQRGALSATIYTDSAWLAGVAWSRYTSWIDSPRPLEATVLIRTALSAAIVIALSYARTAWLGWPLHPIGYLFASSFALEWGMWNVIFVTWLVKFVVVRYGGLHLYRRSVPLFLGLALGDAVAHFVWGIGLGLIGARGASPY